MLYYSIFIIIFSVFVTAFIFLLLITALIKTESFKSLIFRIQSNFSKILAAGNKNKRSLSFFEGQAEWIDNLRIFFENIGPVKVLGINIASPEGLLLARIIIAVSSAVLFIFLGFLFDKNFLFFGLIISVIFYFLPSEILKSKLSLKSRKILKELPDFIDIHASLIRAGLTINESIIYVTKNIKSEISELFSVYHRKIFEGLNQAEAFNIIGKLSFCSEFKSLIKVLHQSELIGNPVRDVLRDLSRVYRNNQRDFLKMRAERLESNLILVIFVFIFIPMLMLFLIPVIPQLKLILG